MINIFILKINYDCKLFLTNLLFILFYKKYQLGNISILGIMNLL
ncbi:hypothetical protein XBFM1_1350031 [Xenorhabdus bovienii str. feltiae Moldova]|uniref:Uncharacterized protein n=1 Tax=Xenorhabdus bovienii str. feltiae Moldova TaxID=1398200 RepID=A0A077NDB4_XENBV|nr:hypothetical protein XBFM1_1350031 [Xenorhabdus bovienii str. feltiae Moldova]